ncbi:MAG: hypothetical protein QXE05_06165 [Nitrososphaeria archaeon]|nr:hypothetical protein [Candidatus Parvarchaeum tengchongense]
MKAQASSVPSEIGLIITGAIFIWIGVTILGIPAITHLVGNFDLCIVVVFIGAGVVAIIGGIFSLLRH